MECAALAKTLDMSFSTVARVWRAHGLKPHLVRTLKVSNDPRFAEKLEDLTVNRLRAASSTACGNWSMLLRITSHQGTDVFIWTAKARDILAKVARARKKVGRNTTSR